MHDKNKDPIKYGSGGYTVVSNNTFTFPSNAWYFKFYMTAAYGTTYNNDICINISDASLNGQYKPYVKQTDDFSSYGTEEDRTGRSAGSAADRFYVVAKNNEYFQLRKQKKIGSVDLGDLNWSYSSDGALFYANMSSFNIKTAAANTVPKILSARYRVTPSLVFNNLKLYMPNEAITIAGNDTVVVVKDSTYTDAAVFKAAMSGVYIVYELATEEDILVADDLLYDQVSLMIEKGGIVTVSESALAGAVELDIPVKRFQN
jgi:hypothetical protein